jgi:hypothetical protein
VKPPPPETQPYTVVSNIYQGKATTMAQNRGASKGATPIHASLSRKHPPAEPKTPTGIPPRSLRHIGEESLSTMRQADIFLLDEMKALRDVFDPAFCAVLACPQCGALGLITISHYCGVVPVICGSDVCSCRFRIDDQSHLTYLPVN